MRPIFLYNNFRKKGKHRYIYTCLSKEDPLIRIVNINAWINLKRGDHSPCVMIDLNIGCFEFSFEWADSRHYNYEKKEYINPEKFDNIGKQKYTEKLKKIGIKIGNIENPEKE